MKYIINNIKVWDEFRKEMGDNEETGDKNITYYIAPSTTEEAVIHYLETNGDPVYLGWASPGKDGAEETIEEYDEEIREWLSEEGWLNRLLGYPFKDEEAEEEGAWEGGKRQINANWDVRGR